MSLAYDEKGPTRPTYSLQERQKRIGRCARAILHGTEIQYLQERFGTAEIAEAQRMVGRTPKGQKSRDMKPASLANLQNGRR